MKKILRNILIYIFLLSFLDVLGNIQGSQIAKKLWGYESLGEITDIKFQDFANFLIATRSGLISTYDLQLRKIINKKNYLYESNFLMDATENCKIY